MSDQEQAIPAQATSPDASSASQHPLESAALRGMGPLSPAVQDVWHGHAQPCVSCGHVVARDAGECDHCGQDLSDGMIEKMAQHAGPWFVLEHVRPFPGVTLERILRQIRRGVLTSISIIRGPETNHQWRFAVESPGLCRYFGKCWDCHAEVKLPDPRCPTCKADLRFKYEQAMAHAAATRKQLQQERLQGQTQRELADGQSAAAPSPGETAISAGDPSQANNEEEHVAMTISAYGGDIGELTAALKMAGPGPSRAPVGEPTQIAGFRVGWIVVALVIIFIVVLARVAQKAPEVVKDVSQPVPAAVAPQEPVPAEEQPDG